MNEIILNKISYEVDTKKLNKNLHIKDDSDRSRLLSLIQEAKKIAIPKGIYLESYIEKKAEEYIIVDDIQFDSRILRVNLEDIHRVFPFIITAGREVYNWAHNIEGILEQYWADKIQEHILQQAISFVFDHIKDRYKLQKTAIMNPGSLEDWPISEQKKLFKLIGNPFKKIGVELTNSFLMIPSKSISGILFPTTKDYLNCKLCPREECPGRRAPYDKKLYKEQYSIKE